MKHSEDHSLLSILLFVALAAPMASAQQRRGGQAGPSGGRPDTYVIGESDLLAINVWHEPELTRVVPVRTDGKITMPLIGELQASGKTVEELRATIATN